MDALVILEAKAAEMLGLSPRTLARFRCDGRGPKYVKLGKRVFYLEADLRVARELPASEHGWHENRKVRQVAPSLAPKL